MSQQTKLESEVLARSYLVAIKNSKLAAALHAEKHSPPSDMA